MGRKIARATGWQVWNPGRYGESWHGRFRDLYPAAARPILVFGLNPGPYGMSQTGIPFTDIKRLLSDLPRLAGKLQKEGEVQVPGLAPRSLRPYLTRTFESSSVRVYRFLNETFGSAERGMQQVVMANPCPLLFMDRNEKKNRTPADMSRAMQGGPHRAALLGEVARLRQINSEDAIQTLSPRAAILLGKNAQAILGPMLLDALGQRPVIDWEHPARAVPATWSSGLRRELRVRGLLPGTARAPRRSLNPA